MRGQHAAALHRRGEAQRAEEHHKLLPFAGAPGAPRDGAARPPPSIARGTRAPRAPDEPGRVDVELVVVLHWGLVELSPDEVCTPPPLPA